MIGKNNPLNIRYNPLNRWKGQTGQTKGFCDFSSLEFGVRAALYLVKVSYAKKGCKTYQEIIRRFAPPVENNSDSYVHFVCDKLSVLPFDVPYYPLDWVYLIHAMSIFEGNEIKKVTINNVYNKYFL